MENWKDIPGYEGRYQVSDLGGVRSLDRAVRTVSRFGREATRAVKGRVLKPQVHSQGYRQVSLAGDLFLVHYLVLLSFVGPRPEGWECAHLDGDKTHNYLRNLRYKTPLENADDRRKHGTSGAGEQNASAKLSEAQVNAIRAAVGLIPSADIAAAFSVHPNHIARIARGERWRSA